MTTTTPRIYVASLSDYNAGRLHGRWIDADQDAESIWEEVKEMLAESKEPIAEEWAIHDYEGFGPVRVDEWDSFERLANIGIGISEYGEAFGAFIEYTGNDDATLEDFEDAYRGDWDNLEDFAAELVDDLGYFHEAPDVLQTYFDYERFARDLELGGDVWTFVDSHYRTHVFWSH